MKRYVVFIYLEDTRAEGWYSVLTESGNQSSPPREGCFPYMPARFFATLEDAKQAADEEIRRHNYWYDESHIVDLETGKMVLRRGLKSIREGDLGEWEGIEYER